MTTFSDLLKKERLKRNLTQKEFGKMLGLSQASIASYENGEKKPRTNRLKEICSILHISPNELLNQYSSTLEIKKIHGAIRVPILAKLSAATSQTNKEEATIGYTYVIDDGMRAEEDLFLLVVKDDSMIGRNYITEGALVLVHEQKEIASGDIVVVHIDDEDAVVRRLTMLDSGERILLADNPAYPPLIVNHRVRIRGKVVEVIFEPR